MTVTMKDIAREAGVSVTTVSKILNERDMNISVATIERVKSIAKQLNYIPNAVAKSLRVKSSNMIGAVIDNISDPFYSMFMRGLEDYARKNGFGIVFCHSRGQNNDDDDVLQFLTSKMIDGIVFDTGFAERKMEAISSLGIPSVAITNERLEIPNVGCVYVDTVSGIYDATCILADLGCEKIACIATEGSPHSDRIRGYKAALEARGLPFDERRVFRKDFTVGTGIEGLRKITSEVDIDGVICGNDEIAVGVLNEAYRLGLKVPEDLKIFGLDDIWISRYLNPSLTTISQPIYELGACSSKMIIDYVKEGIPLTAMKLDYKITLRQTT